MKTIYLHGSLGEQFGKQFELNISKPSEAFDALSCQLAGFRQVIAEGYWEVHRGAIPILSDRLELLAVTMNSCTELHIIPCPEGEKGKSGGTKIIIGAVLVAAAVFTAGASVGGVGALFSGGMQTGAIMSAATIGGISTSTIALVGGAMVLGGVSQMLSPVPEVGSYDEREDQGIERNGLIGGQGNTSEQGAPIPVCIGRKRIGSHIIHVGMSSEELTPIEYLMSDSSKQFRVTTGTRVDNYPRTYIGIGTTVYSESYYGYLSVEDEIPSYGSSSSRVFRERTVYQFAQVFEGGQYYIDVVLGGIFGFAFSSDNENTAFFDRVRIVHNTLGEQFNNITGNATFNPNHLIPPVPYINTSSGPLGLGPIWRYPRWRWLIGPVPILTDATDYTFYLEYTK